MTNESSAFVFRRGVFGSSERGGEERRADVQRRKLVRSYASSVRAEPDPGDGQPADECVAAAAAAVKRQHRPHTRTSYIPCVETPSSVIILRLIDFLRGVRDTRAYLGRPSIVVRYVRSMVAPTREIAEKREKIEKEREKRRRWRVRKGKTREKRDTHDTRAATPY